MKKIILIAILMLASVQIFSQRSYSMEEVYYDELGRKINQEQFNDKLDEKINLPKTYMNDSLVIRMLVNRETYGSINKEHEGQFRELLEKTTGQKIGNKQTVIINYFFEHENCIDDYVGDRPYTKTINKDDELVQFFMTDKTFDASSYSRRTKIHQDKYDVVRRLFFKYEFTCGNYVILKPNGEYYRYFGKYDQDDIVKKAKENWDILDE